MLWIPSKYLDTGTRPEWVNSADLKTTPAPQLVFNFPSPTPLRLNGHPSPRELLPRLGIFRSFSISRIVYCLTPTVIPSHPYRQSLICHGPGTMAKEKQVATDFQKIITEGAPLSHVARRNPLKSRA